MSLLCSLGFHVPDGIPRWNDGYYFASCRRCGRDIVRTAFEKWHEPVGYKVVWSAEPPEDRPEITVVPVEAVASLVERAAEPAPEPNLPQGQGEATTLEREAVPARGDAEAATPAVAPPEPGASTVATQDEPALDDIAERAPAARGPRRRGSALPIEAVFARLRADKAAPSPEAPSLEEPMQPPEQQPAAEAVPMPTVQPAAPRRRPNWDFMDDDDAGEELVPAPAAAPASRTTAPQSSFEEEKGPRLRDRMAGAGMRMRRGASRLTPRFLLEDEPSPLLVIAGALFISSAIALIVTFAIPSPSPPAATPEPLGQQAVPSSGTASAPTTVAQPVKQAFVAASTLSCRSAPTLQGTRVKTLARGARVVILAEDGAWASLGYEGHQCWAEARFISDLPPL